MNHEQGVQDWWGVIGAPPAGTVAALAIGQDEGLTAFIGTGVGVFRSQISAQLKGGAERSSLDRQSELQRGDEPEWKRLPQAPLGILSLAVSPNYAADHTLLAGTHAGIFFSRDGGETWQAARLPLSSSMILALCFSPNYPADGLLLAGTLEDGIFYSDTRGASWSNRGFGLLDPAVYCLAISPHFARDETLFAGTDSALYTSYNGGRAWRPLPFPEDGAPILSLAVSPDFSQDQTLYAGTEGNGLHRSQDRGQSWQKLDLPAASVNALLFSPDGRLLAASGAGVFLSSDQGQTWTNMVDLPNALNLACAGRLAMAGWVDQGAWMAANLVDWQPVANLSTRSFTGLQLSPRFEADGLAFMFGYQEGIWRSADGGKTWDCLNETLPSPQIYALAVSSGFAENRTLAAAFQEGVFLSPDAGNSWLQLAEGPAAQVCFSPNGKLLAAGFPRQGIRLSDDLGKTWQAAPGPWDKGGQVLELAVTNVQHCKVAFLEGTGETVSLWQGQAGQIEKILSRPAGSANPLVSFWIPPAAAADRPWYASLGNTAWKLSSRTHSPLDQWTVFPEAQREPILAFSGVQGPQGPTLFACAGQYIYRSIDETSWTLEHDFGSQRAVALAPSPAYLGNHAVYTLLLGGSFCRGII